MDPPVPPTPLPTASWALASYPYTPGSDNAPTRWAPSVGTAQPAATTTASNKNAFAAGAGEPAKPTLYGKGDWGAPVDPTSFSLGFDPASIKLPGRAPARGGAATVEMPNSASSSVNGVIPPTPLPDSRWANVCVPPTSRNDITPPTIGNAAIGGFSSKPSTTKSSERTVADAPGVPVGHDSWAVHAASHSSWSFPPPPPPILRSRFMSDEDLFWHATMTWYQIVEKWDAGPQGVSLPLPPPPRPPPCTSYRRALASFAPPAVAAPYTLPQWYIRTGYWWQHISRLVQRREQKIAVLLATDTPSDVDLCTTEFVLQMIEGEADAAPLPQAEQ